MIRRRKPGIGHDEYLGFKYTYNPFRERAYECQKCEKTFTTSKHVKRHIHETHIDEKAYKCEYCNKAYGNSKELKQHVRIHTGERPYACEQCDKAFTRSGALTSHLRIHTGEKPYKCKQCDRTFTISGALVVHVRICHTGEKPYKCDQCDKTFSNAYSLKVHTRIHTGEKPHKCDKAFHNCSSLKRHIIQTHTSHKCNKDIAKYSRFEEHKQSHAGGTPNKSDAAENETSIIEESVEAESMCSFGEEMLGKNQEFEIHEEINSHVVFKDEFALLLMDKSYSNKHGSSNVCTYRSIEDLGNQVKNQECAHQNEFDYERLNLGSPESFCHTANFAKVNMIQLRHVHSNDVVDNLQTLNQSDGSGSHGTSGINCSTNQFPSCSSDAEKMLFKCKHCDAAFWRFHDLHCHSRMHSAMKIHIESHTDKCQQLEINREVGYHGSKDEAGYSSKDNSHCMDANEEGVKAESLLVDSEIGKEEMTATNLIEML